jgi:hypothetical protein
MAYEHLALDPTVASASTALVFSAGLFGEMDHGNCVIEMMTQAKAVHKGDLQGVEGMLLGQASALNAMFNEFARRAALNMGKNLSSVESYMRLSLKAQAQCRATLQTLAEIKNPRPVAFVKQANIAHGPQQINNGQAFAPAHAEETESTKNELLEVTHGERLDFGAPGAAVNADPGMATLEQIDGAAHR